MFCEGELTGLGAEVAGTGLMGGKVNGVAAAFVLVGSVMLGRSI